MGSSGMMTLVTMDSTICWNSSSRPVNSLERVHTVANPNSKESTNALMTLMI